MKTLYANGCSMTYGAELGGDILDKNRLFIAETDAEVRKNYAWPNILSTSLNMRSINDAAGGSSNDKIFRTTMEWTCKYLKEEKRGQDLFIVIAWSEQSRKEYKINGYWHDVVVNFPPTHEDLLNTYNFHVENLLDEDFDSIRTLQFVLSLQSWFKINQICYLFCNGLSNKYNKKNEVIKNMLFHIDRKRYFGIDNQIFMYDECSQFPKGPRNHPLTEGHQNWANLLYDYIVDEGLTQYD